MMAKYTMAVLVVLLAAYLLPADLCGQDPELTPEEQKLLQEAEKLDAEGVALYRQAKLPEATERLQKALELLQRIYSKDKYPQGHPRLASGLNNLGVLLYSQGEYGQAEPLYRQA